MSIWISLKMEVVCIELCAKGFLCCLAWWQIEQLSTKKKLLLQCSRDICCSSYKGKCPILWCQVVTEGSCIKQRLAVKIILQCIWLMSLLIESKL